MTPGNIKAFADSIRSTLGKSRVTDDTGTRASASKDYAWISPILAPLVEGQVTDLVVYPENADEMATITRLAFEHGVALTPRGKGTGNYGQSVPQTQGAVLDTCRMQRILEVGVGYLRAEAGTPFTKLEAAANETGQELSIFPSTTNSFLGGFLSGGSGGTGSVANGFLWNGFVKSLKVVPCQKDGVPFDVDGQQTLDHLHGYGTTGLIAEATITLVPKTEWTALFASFPAGQWQAATALGLKVMEADCLPRLLSVDQPSFLKFFPEHPGLPEGRISVRIIADPAMLDTYQQWIEEQGGRVDAIDPKACTLQTFLSYNHVSLRAKQTDPGLCHLQIGGPAVVDKIEAITALLPESTVHLDGMRLMGNPGYGGILISRFIDRDTLYQAMAQLKSLGCVVVNPHHWYLGLGHFPTLSEVLRISAQVDPKGLLNPGRFPPEDVMAQNAASHS